jgi:transcriptional regulator with XRE-family HTH domain
MAELGTVLRQWRNRMSPAEAGLVPMTARRTPGLRREELAQLAGISVDYLTRLEQGRVASPSGQVLEGLARALRLSSEERDIVFALAQRAPRRDRMRVGLTPSVRRLLEQLPSPVCVYDACWTQLAWNRSFAALFGDPTGFRGLEANLLYRYLVGAPTRVVRSGGEGEEYLYAYVADLRATQARFPKDPRVVQLLAALHAESPTFARLWNNHPIGAVHETHKTIDHPDLGLLQLDCDVLRVDGADLRIVVFTAAAATSHADAVTLLASIEVTEITAGDRGRVDHAAAAAGAVKTTSPRPAPSAPRRPDND